VLVLSAYRNIVEIYLGRQLKPGEVVHHINYDHKDNRIENLIVFDSPASHSRLHNQGTGQGSVRRGIRLYQGNAVVRQSRKNTNYDNTGIVLYGPKFKTQRQTRLGYFREKTKRDLGFITV
jgi:hypothetical protein